jgi:hypothetical protein
MRLSRKRSGTQITCFPSTKVQILTSVINGLSGELAGELQELGINLTRTTLAVDPYVTKKQVFKPQQLDLADAGMCTFVLVKQVI